MSEEVFITGPEGALEAAVERSTTPPSFIALVCHPHPLHQGTMQNKVVTTLCRSAVRLGGAAIRFNFRGVGHSEGSYGGHDGALADALAVADWASAEFTEPASMVVCGFSFGGAIAYRVADAHDVTALITVSPAFEHLPLTTRQPECPWLLVQGDSDDVIPAPGVLKWAQGHKTPPELSLFEDTGHFFHGKLGRLGSVFSSFINKEMGKSC